MDMPKCSNLKIKSFSTNIYGEMAKFSVLLEMGPWTWRVKLSAVPTKGYVTLYGNYIELAWLAPLDRFTNSIPR